GRAERAFVNSDDGGRVDVGRDPFLEAEITMTRGQPTDSRATDVLPTTGVPVEGATVEPPEVAGGDLDDDGVPRAARDRDGRAERKVGELAAAHVSASQR